MNWRRNGKGLRPGISPTGLGFGMIFQLQMNPGEHGFGEREVPSEWMEATGFRFKTLVSSLALRVGIVVAPLSSWSGRGEVQSGWLNPLVSASKHRFPRWRFGLVSKPRSSSTMLGLPIKKGLAEINFGQPLSVFVSIDRMVPPSALRPSGTAVPMACGVRQSVVLLGRTPVSAGNYFCGATSCVCAARYSSRSMNSAGAIAAASPSGMLLWF